MRSVVRRPLALVSVREKRGSPALAAITTTVPAPMDKMMSTLSLLSGSERVNASASAAGITSTAATFKWAPASAMIRG